MSVDHIGVGVTAAGHEGDTTVLDVGDCAIDEQIPERPQPDRGKVRLRPIEGGGVVIDRSDYTVRLVFVVADWLRTAIARSRALSWEAATSADVRIVVVGR